MMIGMIVLVAILCSACSAIGSRVVTTGTAASRSSEEERHRLYAAALAASEVPLETELFKDVCRKIGIFDTYGNPNGEYADFVAAHVRWGLKDETEQFRQQISSREKAEAYLRAHLK